MMMMFTAPETRGASAAAAASPERGLLLIGRLAYSTWRLSVDHRPNEHSLTRTFTTATVSTICLRARIQNIQVNTTNKSLVRQRGNAVVASCVYSWHSLVKLHTGACAQKHSIPERYEYYRK